MRSLCSLACVAALLGTTAFAAEKAPIFGQNPDAAYVRGDRVDPFTLGKQKVIITGGDDFRTEWEKLQDALRDADPAVSLRALGQMLTADRDDRFDTCLAKSRQQVELLKAAISYLEQHPEEGAGELGKYCDLLEGFERLEATARRLRARRDIEAEFAGFKLRVDGIVCRSGRASAAVVNGRMLAEGAAIPPQPGQKHAARVRRITPRAVIFVYRGVEIALEL